MHASRDRLVIFYADGTLVDTFPVVEHAFMRHGTDIGDLERFQRRRKPLKSGSVDLDCKGSYFVVTRLAQKQRFGFSIQ